MIAANADGTRNDITQDDITNNRNAITPRRQFLLHGIQIPVHAAEIDDAFVHHRRGDDCADAHELEHREVHVFEVAENGRVQRLLVQSAVGLENFEGIFFEASV
jgi:hypothetical protein